MMEKAYVSKLASFMESFVAFKHSLGWKYKTSEYYLHEFDRYCAKRESEEVLLNEIVKSWVILRDNECPNTQRVRVAPIREFGKYLQHSGYSDAYVVTNKICRKQIRTIPHFFTDEEIIRFFDACDTLGPRKENPVRHLVLPMYFRLLYCCGLRTSEARLLLRKNVNLHTGYIDVIHSKGPKDRRLFLPEDLKQLYLKYDAVIDNIFPDRTYFFPVKSHSCYQSTSIGSNFNKIWKAAGLGHESGSKARAYDFRHHFAFDKLNQWLKEESDVNSMLPYLVRYMGHACLESTYYYLHLVPEFFSTFSEKTKILEGLLPEVDYDEE
ncbi:tyrosine-type recombinase/integrase [Anaerobacillus isosaccharinicus]|uniref:Tyrosine-type recombinase/integrase n=1 Tax=Anaerobacillus isosaccharinicus TaxID=1532552 RepID=A0A7S7L9Q8_9BACI|nr:tyrosine-type recombinase/integrase [Anaerobacillus isosaccharinicus]